MRERIVTAEGVGSTNRSRIIEFGGNSALLVALVVFLAVVPFLPGEDRDGLSARMVWTSLIVAGLFRASERRIFLWSALIVAVPSLVDRWFDLPGDAAVAPVLAAIFVFLVAAHILADIFSRDQIGVDQIVGGINVYLLIALAFGRLHLAAALHREDAYMMGEFPLPEWCAMAGQGLEDTLLYFSFTTITTLGYGDVLPASHLARVLATGEAVLGQLFIAILIARLVSIYSRPVPGAK